MSESNLQADDLGHLGEVAFEWLTSLPPFVVHKVQRDRTGWDFVVELPPPASGRMPLDARDGLIAFLIQVKATYRGKRPTVRLSLSAAEKLAKRPGPSFIVAIAFDRLSHEQRDVYAIEMKGDRLASVLKALRRRESHGRPRINRSSISIPLRASDRLSDATGDALRERLLSTVAEGEDAYIDAKRLQRKSLGYDRDRLTAKLTMHNVTVADVADILVGNRDFHATISDVQERRFGIALPSNKLPSGEGIMRMIPKPQGSCRVKVHSKSLRRPLSFESQYVETRLPGAEGLIERARYDCGPFEIERADTKITLRAISGPNEPRSFALAQWVEFYRAWVAISEGPTTVEIVGRSAEWVFTGSSQQDVDMRARLDLFETAKRLVDDVGLSAEPVSGRQIFDQQKTIYAAVGLSLIDSRAVRIGFEAESAPNEDFPIQRILASAVDLGSRRIAFAAEVTLKQIEGQGDRMWFTQTNRGLALEVIEKTPSAFRAFVDDARHHHGIESLLIYRMSESIDEEFLQETFDSVIRF